MIGKRSRIQLAVFFVVALVSVTYGAFRFADVGEVFRPPYAVQAQFAHDGGIYPQAAVELLGTKVGSVSALRPGPGSGTTVDLTIDHGVRIPRDVVAIVRSKSAIGEQFVQLVPKSAGGPQLQEGGVIPVERTRTPPRVEDLLHNLDSLATSVPKDDLATSLRELADAAGGLGPTLQQLLDDSNKLTKTALTSMDDLTQLIDNAKVVLDTQVGARDRIGTFSRQLAGLTDRLRELDPTFAAVFARGIRAGTEVTNLLQDNQKALPVLLNNLLSITDVANRRIPALRKSLVVLPWVVQQTVSAIRYCDDYDPETGKPVANSCQYDQQGRPVWSAHLALQLIEPPGFPPYFPCIRGYEGTERHLPNGAPLDGQGPRQSPDSPANPDAHCAAPPSDPSTPSVRGAQNAQRPTDQHTGSSTPASRIALYNPNSGVLVAPDGRSFELSGMAGPPPPTGKNALGWLLTEPLS